MIRVSDKPVARIIGQLRRLGLQMRPPGTPRVQPGKVEVPKDIQHQYGGGTLSVRRMLDQRAARKIARNRIGVAARRGGEIRQIMAAAQRPEAAHHIFGNFAPVKPVPTVRGDPLQHLGLQGGAKNRAGRGGAVSRQIKPPRHAAQPAGVLRPVDTDTRRHRNPLPRVANRRCKHIR